MYPFFRARNPIFLPETPESLPALRAGLSELPETFPRFPAGLSGLPETFPAFPAGLSGTPETFPETPAGLSGDFSPLNPQPPSKYPQKRGRLFLLRPSSHCYFVLALSLSPFMGLGSLIINHYSFYRFTSCCLYLYYIDAVGEVADVYALVWQWGMPHC